MKVKTISITVNGRPYSFTVGNNFGDIHPDEMLVDTLREKLLLTGAKKACNDAGMRILTSDELWNNVQPNKSSYTSSLAPLNGNTGHAWSIDEYNQKYGIALDLDTATSGIGKRRKNIADQVICIQE